MNLNNLTVIVPWEKVKAADQEKSVKWQVANTKYEIFIDKLESIDTGSLVEHCTSVRNKVLSTVSTENHKAPSLFKVFERTISFVLRTIWDNIVAEAAENPTEENFDQCMKDFIAAHATPEDRHDLL